MKCVILGGGVVNIDISSIGSICKQWKGYLVASSRKWMLAWGWQPLCIHTTQTEVRVEVWVYCDGNVASGAFEVPVGQLQSESSFSAGAADTTSAQHSLHKSSAALKISLLGTQTNVFFHLFFFFHLSILKRFCYISCIQKFSRKKNGCRRVVS